MLIEKVFDSIEELIKAAQKKRLSSLAGKIDSNIAAANNPRPLVGTEEEKLAIKKLIRFFEKNKNNENDNPKF